MWEVASNLIPPQIGYIVLQLIGSEIQLIDRAGYHAQILKCCVTSLRTQVS